jgi:hypothetical protein
MAQVTRKGGGAATSRRVAKTAAKVAQSSKVAAKGTKDPGERRPSRALGSGIQIPAKGVGGHIRSGAGPAYMAATRLQVSGTTTAHEKAKLSITLDRPIVEEIRELSGGTPLSTTINALLRDALSRYHLGELVAQMQEEAGPVTAEAYEHVFSQWLEE